MVLGIVERIKGFLFSPSETFDASKEDTLGDAFKYFIVILMIYAILIAFIAAVAFSLIGGMLGVLGIPRMPIGAAMAPLVGTLFFVYALVGGIIGVFIFGLWLHLWVYLMGGRNGLFQTIKAVIYGETPILVLGWIPVINLFAAIWMIIVGIIGVRQLHGLSTGTAVIAMILALLIPSIIFVALLAYLMPMIQSLLSDRDLEDIKSPYYSFSYTCFPELEFKGACKLLSSKLRDERVFYLVRLLFPDQKFN